MVLPHTVMIPWEIHLDLTNDYLYTWDGKREVGNQGLTSQESILLAKPPFEYSKHGSFIIWLNDSLCPRVYENLENSTSYKKNIRPIQGLSYVLE